MTHISEVFLLFALTVVALPVSLSCFYLAIAVLLSGRMRRPGCPSRSLRFDIVVPAHDEAPVIARCIASLRRLDWPEEGFRLIVIADNCSDSTASIARAAGARVLRRFDPSRRGKGYALQCAFQLSDMEGWADAVTVIDADSEVSSNLLMAFASRIEQGAHAIQARYGVLNPWTTWRTRLMAIAQAAFHTVRSRARERLRLSCGIRGNGWCVTRNLLQRVPYSAFSLAEDIEYGIDLGLAGFRVSYADEASVVGEAVSNSRSASLQRRRWEGGRRALRRSRSLRLLRAALRRRSRVCFDLALDLLVPPLSQLSLMVATLLLVSLLAHRLGTLFDVLVWLALACAGVLLSYVLRGWRLSSTGARGLMDLAFAPVFVFWKVIVMLRGRGSREWVRTGRAGS